MVERTLRSCASGARRSLTAGRFDPCHEQYVQLLEACDDEPEKMEPSTTGGTLSLGVENAALREQGAESF